MKNEIESFNQAVPEMSSLLELDGAALDVIIGGAPSCPSLTSCGSYGSCTSKGIVVVEVT